MTLILIAVKMVNHRLCAYSASQPQTVCALIWTHPGLAGDKIPFSFEVLAPYVAAFFLSVDFCFECEQGLWALTAFKA